MAVVGYSANQVGDAAMESKFNIILAPFTHVDGTETGLKMSEITPNQSFDFGLYSAVGFQPANDTVQIFDVNGQVDKVLSYVSKDVLENQFYDTTSDPGWYDATAIMSWDFTTPMGETSVNFGEGYVVKAGAGAGNVPTLTYAGAVKQDVTEIPGKPFMFAGNSSPVDIKAKQIKTNQTFDFGLYAASGFQPANDTIQIFNANGVLSYVLSYVSKDVLENQFYDTTSAPGWYDATAIMSWDFTTPMGEVDIPAGSAFVLKCGDGAGVIPTITIPNPLAQKDAE